MFQPPMPLLLRCLVLLLCVLSLCAFTHSGISATPIQYDYKVIAEYPHDPNLFTQGLFFNQDKLYESAGRYGESRLTQRKLDHYPPEQQHQIDDHVFAEGITLLNGLIYQLTWKAGIAYVYQHDSFELSHQYRYPGQGWGLSNNGQQLIMSDGSAQLRFINPVDFTISHSITVTEHNKPVVNLNELEWVEGKIYANVWRSNRLIIINPDSGIVEGSVDLTGLLPTKLQRSNTNVLNGIAYDPSRQRLLVTGKNWPRLFHIQLINPKP